MLYCRRTPTKAEISQDTAVFTFSLLPYLCASFRSLLSFQAFSSFIQAMMDKMETTPVYSTNYDASVGRDEDLDILTYDRILGDIVSSNAIPEELRKTADEVE